MDVILDLDKPPAPLPCSLSCTDPLEGISVSPLTLGSQQTSPATAPPAWPLALSPITTPSTPAPAPSASTSTPQHGARGSTPPPQAPASTPRPPAQKRRPSHGGSSDKAPASPTSSPAAKRIARHSGSPVKAPASAVAWHNADQEDVEPPQLVFQPNRTPGPQLDISSEYRPCDLFQLFFSKEVIHTLCENTNLHAARKCAQGRKGIWTHVSPAEMFQFMSIVIYQGLVRTSTIRDLWRKDSLHKFPFPASVMPGYRYEAILACLHMSDPAADAKNDQLRGTPAYDGLCCLKPLQDQILAACKAYFHPRQNLSIDERMVASKARISMKQYMKNKPTKWGYKLFVLADSSNGYTCDFSIYEGKARRPSGQGLSFDVVVQLLHVPSLGLGYNVYMDNFYTSSKLFHHLHGMGFGACGTIREKRIGFPQTQENALPKNAARGEIRWIREGPLLFVKWRDSRDVTICSTIHKVYGGQTMQRRAKDKRAGTWSTQDIPVPEPVKEYNKHMGGVDLSDALIKYYSVTQKTSRWYMKLFLHFIDIAVVNSFILHKELALARNENPLTQKAFREQLCLELSEFGGPPPCPPAEATGGAKSSSSVQKVKKETGPKGCFPVPVRELSSYASMKTTQGRRLCVHCKMKTIYMCRSCKTPLCIIADRLCFTEWHDLQSKL